MPLFCAPRGRLHSRGGGLGSASSHCRNATVRSCGSMASKRGYCNQDWTQGTMAADGGTGGAYNSGYRLVIDLD